MEISRETQAKMYALAVDEGVAKGKLTQERAEPLKKKRFLQAEKADLNDQLDELTSNNYYEIGEYINECLEKENAALREVVEKCKKYLDDNQLPYENEDDDEEDCNGCTLSDFCGSF